MKGPVHLRTGSEGEVWQSLEIGDISGRLSGDIFCQMIYSGRLG